MLTEDIVIQLAKRLPVYTDLVTSNFSVTSLSQTGTTVTGETSTPHDFKIGGGVNVSGAKTPLAISTFTRVGSVGTIFTSEDHDFTMGAAGAYSGQGNTVAMTSGANEPEFNGDFTITAVSNRRTIEVSIDDSGPTSATGALLLNNGSSAFQSYTGLFAVTSIPTATSFTYELSVSGLLNATGDIFAKSGVRISGIASSDDILPAITETTPNNVWIFAALDDTISSKDRNVRSDFSQNTQNNNYLRQQISQPFSLYAVFPTAQLEIAGRSSRDIAEELFRPICQSILHKKLPTGLYSGEQSTINFVSHGFFFRNQANYIHQYNFEQIAYLQIEDSAEGEQDVAFREIDFSITPDVGNQIEALTVNINLDEDPSL